MKIIVLALLFVVLAVIGYGIYRNKHPKTIGLHEGRLSPCPGTPNCVSSLTQNPSFAVSPFPVPDHFLGSPIALLAKIISEFPRTTLIEVRKDYLHAEFRSKIFSFTDDVEFHHDPKTRVVEVRSASRVGYGDMGVNRARVEELRSRYLKEIAGP